MKTVSLRAILGACLLINGVVVACSSHTKSQGTVATPLGQSTAAGPSDPTVPLLDAAGVPSPDQPAKDDPRSSMLEPHRIRTAKAEPFAIDAGVAPIRGDSGTGNRDAGATERNRADAGGPTGPDAGVEGGPNRRGGDAGAGR